MAESGPSKESKHLREMPDATILAETWKFDIVWNIIHGRF